MEAHTKLYTHAQSGTWVVCLHVPKHSGELANLRSGKLAHIRIHIANHFHQTIFTNINGIITG